jgi:hypothetical protein
MTYVERLNRELTAVGITGRLRRRVAAEIEDHLACDPKAELGEPRDVARRFADELGTVRALRAAAASFAALAFAGILFGVAFVSSPPFAFGAAPPGAPLLGRLANIGAILAPQLAFVGGGLAALRAVRRRRASVVPAAEAAVIVRRAVLGTLAGAATMVSLGVMAVEFRSHLPGWWVTLGEAAAAAGLLALAAALPSLLAALRVRPIAPGGGGDLFDDFGAWARLPVRGHPWRFAFATAGIVAVVIALAGVAASDAIDGALRGIADGLVCLLGFATLGRFLGLWSPADSPGAPEPRRLTADG